MTSPTRHRVVVGLSGGVDSAVTAYLLKQQGHEVVGIFMKNWEDDDDSEYCSSNIDSVDAVEMAAEFGKAFGYDIAPEFFLRSAPSVREMVEELAAAAPPGDSG